MLGSEGDIWAITVKDDGSDLTELGWREQSLDALIANRQGIHLNTGVVGQPAFPLGFECEVCKAVGMWFSP